MVDIAKCSGQNCPFKDECYRYTVHSDSPWQSYIAPYVHKYKEGVCEYFMSNAEYQPVGIYPRWWEKILLWKWLWPVAWVIFMALIYIMSL